MSSYSAGAKEICGVGSCERPAEVMGTETTAEGQQQAHAEGVHEKRRLYCFEHFVEAVEDMPEDASMVAVGRTSDRRWEGDEQILQSPKLSLTPSLQRRLDEYLESE